MKSNDLASQLVKERNKNLEPLIVKHIEELLGRVPTNAEVAAKGRRVRMIECPNEEHFYWGAQRLFSVTYGNAKKLGKIVKVF